LRLVLLLRTDEGQEVCRQDEEHGARDLAVAGQTRRKLLIRTQHML
jgi:hypothetical protein